MFGTLCSMLFRVATAPGITWNFFFTPGNLFFQVIFIQNTWKTPGTFFLNFHYFIVERYLFFTLYSFGDGYLFYIVIFVFFGFVQFF